MLTENQPARPVESLDLERQVALNVRARERSVLPGREIEIGADWHDGETAERYGYVNRALPDIEFANWGI